MCAFDAFGQCYQTSIQVKHLPKASLYQVRPSDCWRVEVSQVAAVAVKLISISLSAHDKPERKTTRWQADQMLSFPLAASNSILIVTAVLFAIAPGLQWVDRGCRRSNPGAAVTTHRGSWSGGRLHYHVGSWVCSGRAFSSWFWATVKSRCIKSRQLRSSQELLLAPPQPGGLA